MNSENLNYEKFKNFVIKNIIFIVVFIVSVIYVVMGFIAIKETGKTLLEIVGESIVVFLFSYFVVESFSMQGIIKGEESQEVKSAKKSHRELREKIGVKSVGLASFLSRKNTDTERDFKTMLLCDYGLSYEQVQNGSFDKTKFTKRQLKKITKIKQQKLTHLTASEILNESFRKNDPLYLGKTKKSFLAGRNISNLSTKIIFTLLFGYFSTAFIGFNPAEIIWKVFQVVLFFIFGLMEYYRAYLYMTGEYVEILNKKIAVLKEFESSVNI